jgi:hypothetical protein
MNLLIPEANRYCFIPLRGDEEHFILKSLLFAEQGNNFLLKNAGKLRRTIGLELNPDVVCVHSNLPAWTVIRVRIVGLLEEFQVNRGGTHALNPYKLTLTGIAV